MADPLHLHRVAPALAEMCCYLGSWAIGWESVKITINADLLCLCRWLEDDQAQSDGFDHRMHPVFGAEAPLRILAMLIDGAGGEARDRRNF